MAFLSLVGRPRPAHDGARTITTRPPGLTIGSLMISWYAYKLRADELAAERDRRAHPRGRGAQPGPPSRCGRAAERGGGRLRTLAPTRVPAGRGASTGTIRPWTCRP